MYDKISKVNLLVFGLLLFGFTLRFLYGWKVSPPPGAPIPNPDEYVALACSVADSNSLLDKQGQPTASREPGYPVLLGVVFKLFGKSYRTAHLANCVMGTAALALLYHLGAGLFGSTVGLMALAVAACYPPFIFYAAQPMRETALLLMTGLGFWIMMEALRRARTGLFFLAGMANATAPLTCTPYFAFGLLAPLGFWVIRKKRPCRALLWSAVYLTGFFSIYALWPLRNHRTLNSWVLGATTATGDHFYMFQLVPAELGGTPKNYEILDQDPVWREGMKLRPIERDKYFWKVGVDRIRENPMRFARLVAWRFFWDQWRICPRPRTYVHSYAKLKWVSILTDGWIIPLGLVGMLLAGLSRPTLIWFYLFIASTGFAYSLVLTMIRYRLAMMPWMILFACWALWSGWSRLRGRTGADPEPTY